MLDCSAAEAAVAWLRDSADGSASLPEMAERWAELVASPAYAAWAVGCGPAGGDLVGVLRRRPPALDGTVADGLPGPARGVLAAFAEGRRHPRQLRARLAQAFALPIDEASARARSVLPGDTALDATVYVLLCGDRQGLANGAAEVTLDLLAVPAAEAGLLATPVVAHELHHIGFDSCQAGDVGLRRTMAAGGPRGAAARAVRILLSEGSANAFFTPTDDDWLRTVAPSLAEAYGREALETWLRRLALDRARLPDLVRELDSVLARLTSGADDPAALAYVAGLTTPSANLARPLAHFVGEAMVQAIRRREGDEAVTAAIADLRRFVPAYQGAAEASGLPRLRAETEAGVAGLWR